MRIGIDACAMRTSPGGVGHYTRELCRALDHAMPEARFSLYSCYPVTFALPSSRWCIRVAGSGFARRMSSHVWLKRRVRALAEADGVDVFWGARTLLPRRSPRYRRVSTVYDLNHLIAPHSMPMATRWAHRLWFGQDVRGADAVVTISQATADRLQRHLGVSADAVIRPAINRDRFGPRAPADVGAVRERHNLRSPYFLAVATLEPRKNLDTLLDAFRRLRASGDLVNHELVLVGAAGWGTSGLRSDIERSASDGIRYLGYVSDADMASLYAGAAALAIPSHYEGFGMPAMEARACGTVVLASDIPELREASGNRGIFVPPTMQGLCEGLLAASRTAPEPAVTRSDWRLEAARFASVIRQIGD